MGHVLLCIRLFSSLSNLCQLDFFYYLIDCTRLCWVTGLAQGTPLFFLLSMWNDIAFLTNARPSEQQKISFALCSGCTSPYTRKHIICTTCWRVNWYNSLSFQGGNLNTAKNLGGKCTFWKWWINYFLIFLAIILVPYKTYQIVLYIIFGQNGLHSLKFKKNNEDSIFKICAYN